MLANLAQLPLWVWIIAIVVIVAVTGVIIWARRRKLHVTGFEVTAGPVKAKLEIEKPAPAPPSVESPSVNISGNVMWGKNRVGVRREGTNITDNKMLGENEIEVGAKPGPKPKAKKGKQSK